MVNKENDTLTWQDLALPCVLLVTGLLLLALDSYGFVPLKLDPSLDFAAMFHGVDERVPLDALEFGCKVLDRFLTAA